MSKLNYEGLSAIQNTMINTVIDKLRKLENCGLITKKEKEYKFLTSLQGLYFLSSNQVFNIYINTEI